MANLSDYLDWRSDVPMDIDPFNEVDNLLLSYLAYVDYTDVVPMESLAQSVSITEVARHYFELHSDDDIMSSPELTKTSAYLLKKMVHTKRFGKVRLAAYRQRTDRNSSTQFAAISYLLPDKTCFAAYRGTDNSIVGWKEDFNLSLEKETQGQIYAKEYLDEVYAHKIKKLRVGGHSKGGNFAMYAGAFCKLSIQKRILAVYSNDGPGFREKVVEAEGYKRIKDRIYSYIPEDSIVGILLEQKNKKQVIKTSINGVMAHNPQNWEIERNHFVRGKGRSKGSIVFDKTIRRWIYDVNDERRKFFIDAVFGIMESTGATNLIDLIDPKEKAMTLGVIREALGAMSKEDQKVFWGLIRKFISSGTSSFVEEVLTQSKKSPTSKR